MTGRIDAYDYIHGKIKPRNDNLLVQIEKPPTETASGIVLPQRDPNKTEGVWAKVIAVGGGPGYIATCDKCCRPRWPTPMGVRAGDRVLLDMENAGDVLYTDLGELRMVRQAECLAVEEA